MVMRANRAMFMQGVTKESVVRIMNVSYKEAYHFLCFWDRLSELLT